MKISLPVNSRILQVNILLLILLLSAASLNSESNHDSDRFYLRVKLQDIYNPTFEICLPIKIGKPFHVTANTGEVTNTISGTLLQPKNDKYPLDLMISEWESEKSNLKGTNNYQLELNKSYSQGFVSSVVFNRTVTLTKQ